MAGEQEEGTGGQHRAQEGPADGARGPGGVTRRNFIGGAGVLGAAAAYDIAFAHARAITGALPGGVTSVIGEIGSILENGKPTFSTLLRRREDFLLLRVDAYNMVRRRQHLVREFDRAAYLVITHQPQHVIEEAFLEPPVAGPKPPGNSKALLAYPSRLAFLLPDGTDSIPLTVAGLLDWAALDPSLSPFAAYEPFALIERDISKPGPGGTTPVHVHVGPPPRWPPKVPAETETAIELPWHLVISPTSSGLWSHPTDIVQARGWAELWHTRLAAGSTETAADGGAIRGIWTYDLRPNGKSWFKPPTNPPNVENPFLTSLNPSDRYEIVEATSDFSFGGRADVTANKLWLSARGGFLDSIGEWDSTKLNLAEWKHLATLGRDQYVKVVYYGFLYPFGHRVVLTKITERMFEKVDGQIVATSRQIHFLTVKEPVKSYDPADTFGIANNSRDFPFRSLDLKTLRTPDLSPMSVFVSGLPSSDVFIPEVAGAPFLWHFVGTDWIGQEVAFTAPAVFVIQSDGFDPTNSMKVRNAYNALPLTAPSIRVGQFTGSEVAFAASHTAGDTNLGVQSMTFGAGAGTGGSTAQFMSNDQPICYPNLAQAAVVLSAAAQASGGGLPSTSPIVNYHPTFVSDDFNSPGNQGNLFLEIGSSSQPAMNFNAGSSGGVMLPDIQLSGLSRSLGPVAGDVSNILGGTFDPSSVFSGLNATILGGVKLIDLIKLVTGLSGDSPSTQAMQILYSTVGSGGMAADRRHERRRSDEEALLNPPIPTTRTTHFTWSPDISDNPIVSKDSDSSNPLSPAVPFSFDLDGTVTTDLLNPANSKFKLVGTLKGFDVSLMDNSGGGETFIAIHFKELTFTAASGQKSTVTVEHRRGRLPRGARVHRATRGVHGLLGRRRAEDHRRRQWDHRRPVGRAAADRGRDLLALQHRGRRRLQPAVRQRPRTVPLLVRHAGRPVHAVGRDLRRRRLLRDRDRHRRRRADPGFVRFRRDGLDRPRGRVGFGVADRRDLLRLRPDRPARDHRRLHPHRVRQARRQPQHPRDHHVVAGVRPEPHLRGSGRLLVGHRHRHADGRCVGLLLQLLGFGDGAEDLRRRRQQQLRRQPQTASDAELRHRRAADLRRPDVLDGLEHLLLRVRGELGEPRCPQQSNRSSSRRSRTVLRAPQTATG